MKEVEIWRKRTVLIDDDDFDKVSVYKWRVNKRGYALTGQYPNTLFLHHLIVGRKKGYEVDHINRSVRDNRKENLRFVTKSQNRWNSKKRVDNQSGYIGVSWHNQRRCWTVRMHVDGIYKHFGLFQDPKDAARAYNQAALTFRGEFASLNAV